MREGRKPPERTEIRSDRRQKSRYVQYDRIDAAVAGKIRIDVEHIDQLEIVRKAEEVDEAQVEKAFNWLTENVGKIEYNGTSFTPEKLKTQIRHYEATKKIVKRMSLTYRRKMSL